jgi:acetyl-CoA carboxylase carboxyltransferase component
VIAVANDITFNSGAFGTREDAVFRAATEHALDEKLPLVYLAANAGARVGLATEVKQCLQVRGTCSSKACKACMQPAARRMVWCGAVWCGVVRGVVWCAARLPPV